jgi:hypothetical protein
MKTSSPTLILSFLIKWSICAKEWSICDSDCIKFVITFFKFFNSQKILSL